MREIKFRAWWEEAETFLDVEVLDFHNEEISYSETTLDNGRKSTDEVLFKDVVLEQYTGLKDDNGKEIYEGDIVAHYSDDMVVKFIDGSFVKSHSKEHHYPKYYPLEHGAVVKGNVHENPELLK